MHTHSRHAAGFTLLEAIVALAIMSLALIPLVSFIAQAANELERAGDANDQSLVTQSVVALMEPINPIAEPKGELPLDRNISVAWDSQIVVKPNDGVTVGAGLAAFRIGFYNVHVTVTRLKARWFEFDLRKVGYDRIQAIGPPGGSLGK